MVLLPVAEKRCVVVLPVIDEERVLASRTNPQRRIRFKRQCIIKKIPRVNHVCMKAKPFISLTQQDKKKRQWTLAGRPSIRGQDVRPYDSSQKRMPFHRLSTTSIEASRNHLAHNPAYECIYISRTKRQSIITHHGRKSKFVPCSL